MRKKTAARVVWVLLLGACSTEPVRSTPEPFLRATVTGSVRADYEGTGTFQQDGNPAPRSPLAVGLRSDGEGAAAGQSFSLWRRQAERLPQVGRYPLVLPDDARDRWPGFAGVYTRETNGAVEMYVATSGEVEVTGVAAERIAGTFRFTGARYCARSVRGSSPPAWTCTPAQVDPGAPVIEAAGSFAATPGGAGAVGLDRSPAL
jgi:hypothetical protein